ncbi:MAG: SAM-dependent chlorinase/fluorinase [Actinobacteria bacterium]|nr:SAM-dependent chlorinase/fluorinase [Actinomycetota bacterium]
MARPIVFLTDFGVEDEFVGVCKAVVAGIAPDASVIDLTHAIPPQDVLAGALTLARAAPYLPADAVVLAVVDPGVGTARRPIAVEAAAGPILVGPDNGLLSLAWEVLGGVRQALVIENDDLFRRPVSATFHGRDVFSPVAAHLAAGLALEEVGSAVSGGGLVRVGVPAPVVGDGRIEARVLSVDRFGNVQLNVRPQHLATAGLGDAVTVDPYTLRRVASYADVGPRELAFLVDSSGWLAVVANGGSAAVALAVGRGDAVILTPPAGV